MDLGRFRNNQNWNIGFCEISPSDLLEKKHLPHISWLNHNFRDRFFADPFILYSDSDTILVLVEEMKFNSKGKISLLVVDSYSYNLVDRKVLLEFDTHLSYPAVIRDNEKIYVYPENYSKGELNLYELNMSSLSLKHRAIMIKASLTDATVFQAPNGKYYMISTLSSNCRNNAFLYVSDSLTEAFSPVFSHPVVTGVEKSRCGGSVFEVNGRLFRPAQNCSSRYGGALKIMEIMKCSSYEYSEKELFELSPKSWRYNLGLHTLNFGPDNNLAVIDSYGFLYPSIGRILDISARLYHKVKNTTKSLCRLLQLPPSSFSL